MYVIRAFLTFYDFYVLSPALFVQYFPLFKSLSFTKMPFLFFGANTLWYLQFHFVCAKLFASTLLCGMVVILRFVSVSFIDWQVANCMTQIGGFFSWLTSLEPTRLSRGFLYKKIVRYGKVTGLIFGTLKLFHYGRTFDKPIRFLPLFNPFPEKLLFLLENRGKMRYNSEWESWTEPEPLMPQNQVILTD